MCARATEKWNSVDVYDSEVVEKIHRRPVHGSQVLLVILKEKGAPIKGAIILEPSDEYDWFMERDHMEMKRTFGWKLKGE